MTLIKIKKELSMSFSLLQIKDDVIPEKKNIRIHYTKRRLFSRMLNNS